MNQSRRRPSGVLEAEFAGTPATLREARRALVEWIEGHGADPDACQRAELIVSELASNAVQASPGMPYRISAQRIDDERYDLVVVNTLDDADAVPPRDEWGPDDVLATRGRGLVIVEALAEQISVEQGAGSVTVRARLRF